MRYMVRRSMLGVVDGLVFDTRALSVLVLPAQKRSDAKIVASWVQKSLFTKRCQFLRARARQLARMPNRLCDSPCSRGVS